jgi:hypothetical protein
MKSEVQIVSCGMIYICSFMKTGTGVQAIPALLFCFKNITGCNVGVTDGWHL